MAGKIVVDKFDVCYKFCDDHVRQCLNIDCQIAHNVSGDDFVNFIDYNNSLAKLIDKVVTYI